MIFHDINDISWYFMIFPDISWYQWYFMIFHDISWYFMIFHDVSWYFMIFHDISWYQWWYPYPWKKQKKNYSRPTYSWGLGSAPGGHPFHQESPPPGLSRSGDNPWCKLGQLHWLVVLTPLKSMSQWKRLSHILWNIKNVWNQPVQDFSNPTVAKLAVIRPKKPSCEQVPGVHDGKTYNLQ